MQAEQFRKAVSASGTGSLQLRWLDVQQAEAVRRQAAGLGMPGVLALLQDGSQVMP